MTTALAGANVSSLLRERAAGAPERPAVVTADGRRLSFAELDARADALARGLAAEGLVAGERASLFVPPGPELVLLTHALFRLGAVPVLIDPGMGRAALLSCIERVRPHALIGVPRAHLARQLFPRAFRTVRLAVTVGRRLGWQGPRLADLERPGGAVHDAPPSAERPAAILFTSGSTGPAKGVLYTHAVFRAQLELLRWLYGLEPGEVDAACFPLFALFDHALGMTSVFPPLDPARPARCDPARLFACLEREGATFAFGSPSIWKRLLPWARARGARFSRLTRVTIAGAPVPPRLVTGLRAVLAPGGEVHTPYGATEALPVASVSGAEIADGLAERSERGEGTCVGRPVPGLEVRLARLTDEPLAALEPGLEVAPGEPGEVCVRGPVVTAGYAFDAEATRAARIPGNGPDDGAGDDPGGPGPWHRMGDVGRFDSDGRLWFLGRKSHRLETERGTVLPVPVENAANACPGVRRSALVGVGPRGRQRPWLVVERERGARRAAVREGARARAAEHGGLAVDGVLFRRRFPVDVRHNAKIRRGELARWAEGRVR